MIVAYIDGERMVFDEYDIEENHGLTTLSADGMEFYLFNDTEEAGEAAREYWEDMASNDPAEFTCMVGEAALVAWGLNQDYAVGSIGVSSLQEWLDLWESVPEEHFASYDHLERDFVCRHPDYSHFTIAYRHN